MARVTKESPAPKVHHKRRAEAELRKSLADYAEGKPLLRDDERQETLADGITELIELRRILLNVTQALDNLHGQTMTDIRKILSPQ